MNSGNNLNVSDSRCCSLSDDKLSEQLSTIPKIEIPKFEVSQSIQLFLDDQKDKLSEIDKYLLTSIDKLQQTVQFIIPIIKDSNVQARITNGKVIRLTDWKSKHASDLEEAAKLVNKHEEILEKKSFLLDVIRVIANACIGLLGGLVAWFAVAEHIFK